MHITQLKSLLPEGVELSSKEGKQMVKFINAIMEFKSVEPIFMVNDGAFEIHVNIVCSSMIQTIGRMAISFSYHVSRYDDCLRSLTIRFGYHLFAPPSYGLV